MASNPVRDLGHSDCVTSPTVHGWPNALTAQRARRHTWPEILARDSCRRLLHERDRRFRARRHTAVCRSVITSGRGPREADASISEESHSSRKGLRIVARGKWYRRTEVGSGTPCAEPRTERSESQPARVRDQVNAALHHPLGRHFPTCTVVSRAVVCCAVYRRDKQ
jgi:hypothetical protein